MLRKCIQTFNSQAKGCIFTLPIKCHFPSSMGLVSFAAALLPFQLQPLRNAKNYPDLHPSQLYCTQLHWHLSTLFVSQYFCPLSLWALVSKEGACLVCSPHIWSIWSNLLSPQYIWCSLEHSTPTIPLLEKGLFCLSFKGLCSLPDFLFIF